jgi:hypothetical protein
MVIADKLRRGERGTYHREILRNAPECCAAVFHALRMTMQLRQLETLEKMARAIEVALYQLFCDGEEPPKLRLTSRSSDHFSGECTQTAVQFKETYL